MGKGGWLSASLITVGVSDEGDCYAYRLGFFRAGGGKHTILSKLRRDSAVKKEVSELCEDCFVLSTKIVYTGADTITSLQEGENIDKSFELIREKVQYYPIFAHTTETPVAD